jgi:hypothetical protein
MRARILGGIAVAYVCALCALCVSISSGIAGAISSIDPHSGLVTGGCVRPTGPGHPHAAFYGVEAIAKPDVTAEAIISITPHNEAQLWCSLSFVIDERTHPLTVRVVFLKKATRHDEGVDRDFLKHSGLFSRVWVLPTREWVPVRPGT